MAPSAYKHPFPAYMTPPPVTAHLDAALKEETARILEQANICHLTIGEEFETTPPIYPGEHYRAKFLELCAFMAERMANAGPELKNQYTHEYTEMQEFSAPELLALDLHFNSPAGLLIHRKFGSSVPALSIYDSTGVMEVQTLRARWDNWLAHRDTVIETLIGLVKQHGMELGIWNDDHYPMRTFGYAHEFFFFCNTHKHMSAVDAFTGEKLLSAGAPNYLTNGVMEGLLFMAAHGMAAISEPHQLVSGEQVNGSIARGNTFRFTLETAELRRNPFPPREHAALTGLLIAAGMAYGRTLAKNGYDPDIERVKSAERGIFKSIDQEESLFMTARTLDMCYLEPMGGGTYLIRPPLEYFKRSESMENIGEELGYPFGERHPEIAIRALKDLFSSSVVDSKTGRIHWADKVDRPATILTGMAAAPAFDPYSVPELLKKHAAPGLGARTPETAYAAAVSLFTSTLERTGLVRPALIRDLDAALRNREIRTENLTGLPQYQR